MKKVPVSGAGGQVARWVIEILADSKHIELTPYLRHARKLARKAPQNAKIAEGDVLDRKTLNPAEPAGKEHHRVHEGGWCQAADLHVKGGTLRARETDGPDRGL